MSTLHLIQKPITTDEFLSQLERYYQRGDSVLLLNDAVFSLTALCESNILWESERLNGGILALNEQVKARGLDSLIDLKKVSTIDYPQFVELSFQAQKAITW